MKGSPKYNYGDWVYFDFQGETLEGSIYIIDKYGTFEDDSDVSYDIMARYNGQQTLFKHIKETYLRSEK